MIARVLAVVDLVLITALRKILSESVPAGSDSGNTSVAALAENALSEYRALDWSAITGPLVPEYKAGDPKGQTARMGWAAAVGSVYLTRDGSKVRIRCYRVESTGDGHMHVEIIAQRTPYDHATSDFLYYDARGRLVTVGRAEIVPPEMVRQFYTAAERRDDKHARHGSHSLDLIACLTKT